MSVDLALLWTTGELTRLARETSSRGEFASRLGMTEDAVRKRMRRLGIPSWREMSTGAALGRGRNTLPAAQTPANRAAPEDFDVDVSDFDDAPTNPSGTIPPEIAESYRSGYRETDTNIGGPIPPGHYERGRSTLVDGDGNVRLTWHKTTVSQQQHLDAIMRVLEEMPTWRGLSEPVEQQQESTADLLAVYCLGDPHLGEMTWGKETGTDHDLATGVRDLIAAVDHLVDIAPPADTAIVLSLGDLVHVDSEANTTTRGTKQDADSRWFKVMQETLRSGRCLIDKAKQKHRQVLGRIIRGNHDWHSSAMIAMGLAQFYENDPRVEIEVSPDPFSWYEFGKNLLGFSHTDECSKAEQLAGVMAVDQAEAWGRTVYRFMLGGHLHHQQSKETNGVLVERFPTLAPKCSWAHRKGYRALQSMCVDTYHREWGRINRSTVGIRQLRAA